MLCKRGTDSSFIIEVKKTNFFIYAFHWMLLYLLAYPLGKMAGEGSDFTLMFVYFVEIFLCCSMAIVIGMLLNRFCPRFMKVLNGR